ncbi:MAG: hypothetical protein QN183_05725 [Armatimonadota bacterium]|nr:hypothetical protein [Armatimonadota bacterium]
MEGWAALRAFFAEGAAALTRALEAFRAAEAAVRAAGDPARLDAWLLGQATALRYTRQPEAMEAALARARELVNLVTRAQSEGAAVPYRTHVEAICSELADVVPAEASRYLEQGLAYSERTLRLARASRRAAWLAAAQASRGELLRRRAADRRERARATAVHADARRRWPPEDRAGRAQAAVGYAEALVAAGRAARAEAVAREAIAVLAAGGDRYHEAAARLALARALAALDQPEAFDEQAAAVDLYRRLGCRWEQRRAEAALV